MSRLCVYQDLGCGENVLFEKHSTAVFLHLENRKTFFFLNKRQHVKCDTILAG